MRPLICLFVAACLTLHVNRAAADKEADAIIDKAIKAHTGSGKYAKKLGYRAKWKGTLNIGGMELPFTQEEVMQTGNSHPQAALAKPIFIKDRLTDKDPRDAVKVDCAHKVHVVQLHAGMSYQIDLDRKDAETKMDPFLRIEDTAKKQLAHDDDSGGGLNASLLFTAPREGDYRIIATCLYGTGEYTLKVVPVTIPSKFKEVMNITILNQKIQVVTVFNGKEAWIKTDGKDTPVEKDVLEEFKDVATLENISQGVFLKDSSLDFAVIGEAMVNGKPSIGVKVSRTGKKAIDMYFDKETHLLSKMQRRKRDLLNNAGQEVTEERIIVEYQKLGGRTHAKKFLVNVDGKKFMEAEVTEAEFLDRVNDGEFVRP